MKNPHMLSHISICQFLLACALGFLPLEAGEGAATGNSASGSRPNILFILTDDLGYGDVGVFYQNQRHEQGLPSEFTPNLDALAGQGIQLRDHYTSAPVCAPARATLLSGASQGNAGVRDNQFDKALDDNHSLASVLKQAGYSTAAIGKWGLQGAKEIQPQEDSGTITFQGSPDTWPAYPTKRGFDYFYGYVRHRDGHEHYPKEGLYDGHKQVWDMDHEVSAGLAGCYTADLFTARAKKWITDSHTADPNKPFFLYLAYDTPHAVLEYPPKAYPPGGGLTGGMQWLGQPGRMINTADGKPDSYCYPAYANATYSGGQFGPNGPQGKGPYPWPVMARRYASSVQRIDDCVGDLMQLLRDLHIDQNTLVIFTSDNGPSIESYMKGGPGLPNFLHSFGPFDGIKRDCWEGGIREGAIVSWPDHIPAGRVDQTASQFQDWMPTLADVAGVPAPARTDGVSLVPTLTGQPGQRASTIYSEYFFKGNTPNFAVFAPAHRNRYRGQMQVVRVSDFVGVRYNIQHPEDDFEIYDIIHDPQEVNNLAAQKPDLDKRMKELALQDRMPDASVPRPYDKTLVPPDAPESVVPGIHWQAYEASFPWLPKLEFLTPSASGDAVAPDVSVLPRQKDVGVLYSGYIKAPADGTYVFSLAADGKALLRIHDATVIDEDFGYTGGTRTAKLRLAAGPHALRLYYMPGQSASLNFQWAAEGETLKQVPASAYGRPGR
jgi:arylsulfatase A-like enzyme